MAYTVPRSIIFPILGQNWTEKEEVLSLKQISLLKYNSVFLTISTTQFIQTTHQEITSYNIHH